MEFDAADFNQLAVTDLTADDLGKRVIVELEDGTAVAGQLNELAFLEYEDNAKHGKKFKTQLKVGALEVEIDSSGKLWVTKP